MYFKRNEGKPFSIRHLLILKQIVSVIEGDITYIILHYYRIMRPRRAAVNASARAALPTRLVANAITLKVTLIRIHTYCNEISRYVYLHTLLSIKSKNI